MYNLLILKQSQVRSPQQNYGKNHFFTVSFSHFHFMARQELGQYGFLKAARHPLTTLLACLIDDKMGIGKNATSSIFHILIKTWRPPHDSG